MAAQTDYWDRVAREKTFSHPLPMDKLKVHLSLDARILDLGCGYGRTCKTLQENGYTRVIGVDTSHAMIKRGIEQNPTLDLLHLQDATLPFEDHTFDACFLLAVLTCIPDDEDQFGLLNEISRVLKPGGLCLASDYPLQQDARNMERYTRFKDEYKTYGVFRKSDGGVMRHHDSSHFDTLFSGFSILDSFMADVATMNGNPARIIQILAIKKS